jgi:hypothetical protein
MVDIRKVIIIFVIGILFSVLVFSTIDAIYPQPKYDDFCDNPRIPKLDAWEECSDKCDIQYPDNDIAWNSCVNKCDREDRAISLEQEEEYQECNDKYQDAREIYNQYVFYISAILALIAIFIGMYLPAKKNTLNEWIGTGFMLGGTFVLLFGTLRTFTALGRYVKPIIILLELILVIFITYKKIGNLKPDKKK